MKRLAEHVDQLERVLHAVANGITIQDTQGKLVFVNQAAARMMDCKSPEEAMAKGAAGIVAGFTFFDEKERQLSIMDLPGRRALGGEEEPEMVVGFTGPNHKGIRWTSIKALPVLDDDGSVLLAVNVLQDVTQQKETERQLKDAHHRAAKLLEQTLRVEN